MDTGKVSARPVAVLAHAAWFDGSSWAKVIAELSKLGVESVAVQLPLTSLAEDAAAVRRVIDRQRRSVVLVGHSYGRAVVTKAGAGHRAVRALAYVAAIVPDAGETVAAVFSREPPQPEAPALTPDAEGLLWIDQVAFDTAVAPDASEVERAGLAAVQKPISMQCLGEPLDRAAWHEKPVYYLVAERDRMVAPQTQRFLADRMQACTTSLPVDHTPLLSAPVEVANFIAAAVNAVRGAWR
jgi:pimeloyl-ACP methyl ester carboxylesterase